MYNKLTNAIIDTLEFKNININSISKIDARVGFIWFKVDDKTYIIDIHECDFDIDNYQK